MLEARNVLVRTASEARAAFSRFALIADEDVSRSSFEGSVKLNPYHNFGCVRSYTGS